jgi:hypothetical protein
MPAFLALIPRRVYEYGTIILVLSLAFGWYTVRERRAGAAHEVIALQKSSAELTAKADKQIAALTAAHTTELKKVVADNDAKNIAADSQHTSDLKRLRDADAYRRSRAAVQSAAQPGGTPTTGGGGASENESRFERLEQVSSGLADALRYSDAALSACMAERASVASPLF